MISQFEELLREVGSFLGVQLHIDRKSACSIQIQPGLTIQLQLDSSQEFLFLFAKIAEVPPGKFRELILQDALKANGLEDPVAAVFGYLFSTHELAQFQKYPLSILNGETLSGLLGSFLEVAQIWQRALQNGISPYHPKK